MSIEKLDVSKPSLKGDLKNPLTRIQNECAARCINRSEFMFLHDSLCKTTKERAIEILASGHIYPLRQLLQIYPDFFDEDTLIVEPEFHTPTEKAGDIRVRKQVARSTRKIIEQRNRGANMLILHTAGWNGADIRERLVVCDGEMRVICGEHLGKTVKTPGILRMILGQQCIAITTQSGGDRFYFPEGGILRSFNGPINIAA